jgi:NAD(P)-dependent dehydrogenase (short-subunit alcohol dehydrogenase family)
MWLVLDAVLDRGIVGGYTKLGYLSRRPGWTGDRADPPAGALHGRTALVTGASSGLGEATAIGLARLGARVHLLVRDPDKGEQIRRRVTGAVPGAAPRVEVCDVGELADVRRFASDLLARVPELHLLVHNAGLLPDQRRETSEGNELTLAVHVLGPHLLTALLRPALAAAGNAALTGRGNGVTHAGGDSRVLFVSSGGMYAQPLKDYDPQYRGRYNGTAAYARTKRTQVVLAGEWARELAGTGISVHALHPGWAATPGITGSLPGFARVVGPLLRTPEQGADTAVWLAGAPARAIGTGQFWHDRAPRPAHYFPHTRETPAQRARFWARVQRLAPLHDPATA